MEEVKEKKSWRSVALAAMIVVGLAGVALATNKWGAYRDYPIARLMINDSVKNPTSPAINIKGSVYVPLRYISENLGVSVDWDQSNQTVKITSGSGTTTATTQPTAKQWVNVTTLSGSADKTGGVFKLSGTQTRLVYAVDGDYPVCAIYVMKEGTSLEKNGGSSVVMVTDNANDSTMLIKDAGNYYFDVKAANCNWTVTIQEYK
jgi:hypothetical protein